MKFLVAVSVCAFAALGSCSALAVPSFARQTGFECTTCHVSWPELTSVGRQFKLGGFTLMRENSAQRPWLPFSGDDAAPRLPLAAMVQGSLTATRRTGEDPATVPRNDDAVLQQLSAFYAGRIAEHFGAFAQWTYDGVAHRGAIDNVDLRYAARYAGTGTDVAYGITVNNNPTVSDIYNSTPTWGFPFASSGVAVAPNATTLVDGGLAQQVAGVGVYGLWNQTLYTELAAYRTADRALSLFRAGTDKSSDAVLDGPAPYWRLALQHAWDSGTHTAMIGTYGLVARRFPDPGNPSGPSDRFRDIGVDAQYQFVTDRHRFAAQVSWIDERQQLDATFATGDASNATNTLRTLRAKATYYFDLRYGATLQYFRTDGSGDDALYDSGDPVTGSASGSPRTSGMVAELDWLPRRDLRVMLQYTAYREFNGARHNYDGFGRDAGDNNTLYLVLWWMI